MGLGAVTYRDSGSDETPAPTTKKQTGSYAMAEAKRVFLREYAGKARAMARIIEDGQRRAALLAFEARCTELAAHFERWAGAVIVDGKMLPARRDDETERLPDLAAYAQCVSDAQTLGVRF